MQHAGPQVTSLDDLLHFVHHTLCAGENLLPEQFHTLQRPLYTHGELSGMEYALQGLRNVRLSAIWAAEPNSVYFYDAAGERRLKVQLATRPDVSLLARSA